MNIVYKFKSNNYFVSIVAGSEGKYLHAQDVLEIKDCGTVHPWVSYDLEEFSKHFWIPQFGIKSLWDVNTKMLFSGNTFAALNPCFQVY